MIPSKEKVSILTTLTGLPRFRDWPERLGSKMLRSEMTWKDWKSSLEVELVSVAANKLKLIKQTKRTRRSERVPIIDGVMGTARPTFRWLQYDMVGLGFILPGM